jgi:pimeloyl-ACP methyl ester carboxylesterase
MRIVDMGHGDPVVLIPGIQGRWEWMRPAVDALARHCRVVTFSLADEPTAKVSDNAFTGFDAYVAQVGAAMRVAGLDGAVVCGVSYGGLIAAAFAARHQPRVSGLALVSALPPFWKPDTRAGFYLRSPRLYAPLFCVASLRLYPEIAAADEGLWRGVGVSLRQLGRVVTHPFDARRMARRVRLAADIDWTGIERLRIPTLLVTGEASLDRVVPPALTREYLHLWPHARHVTLERTGHLGLVTRPDEFAATIASFAHESRRTIDGRRRIG